MILVQSKLFALLTRQSIELLSFLVDCCNIESATVNLKIGIQEATRPTSAALFNVGLSNTLQARSTVHRTTSSSGRTNKYYLHEELRNPQALDHSYLPSSRELLVKIYITTISTLYAVRTNKMVKPIDECKQKTEVK